MNSAQGWTENVGPRLGSAAAAPKRIVVVERREQLGGLERDWKRLWRQAPAANPFLSWEWQRAWIEAQPATVRPLIVAEMAPDGSLAGLLAWQRVRRRGLRQLEFLGQGSGGDDLDCLLHPQAGWGVARRLLQAALGRAPWDVLRLEGMRPAGGAGEAATGHWGLEEALRAQTPAVGAGSAGEWLPYLPLPSSFEQLLAGRSANFRSEVRRRRRGLERRAPGLGVECVHQPAAVAAGLQHLYRLHNQRRAQKHGHGIFEAPALRAFHARAASQLAASGSTRLYLLRTEAAVIAALYGFQAGERFFYFQSGFDPAWTEWSPGTVLLSAVVEDCIERGLRQFEFLRGDESYKARWASERRQGRNWLQAGSVRGKAFLRLRGWNQAWQRRRAAARRPPEFEKERAA